MINPIAVTTNELSIKGKNPNLPEEGCHAEEKSNCPTSPILKIGVALMMRLSTISNGKQQYNKYTSQGPCASRIFF